MLFSVAVDRELRSTLDARGYLRALPLKLWKLSSSAESNIPGTPVSAS
jgi:hypothetical protein